MVLKDIRRNLYAYLLNKAQLFTDIKPDQLEVPNWYATSIEIADVAVLPDCINIPGVAISQARIDKLIFSVGISGIKIDIRGFFCSLSLTEPHFDGAFAHAMEESVHDLLDALNETPIAPDAEESTQDPSVGEGYGVGDTKGLFTRLAELALSQIQVTIDSALVECVLPSGTILKLDLQQSVLSSAKLQAAKLTIRQGLMDVDGKARSRRSSRDNDRYDTATSMIDGVSLLLASQVLELTDFTCGISNQMDEVKITAAAADLNWVSVLENLGELLNHFVFIDQTTEAENPDSSSQVNFSLDVKKCRFRQEHSVHGSSEIYTSVSLSKDVLQFGEVKVGQSLIPSPSLLIDFSNNLSINVYNPISLDLTQKQFASLATFLLDVQAAISIWNLPKPTSQAIFNLALPEIKLAVEDRFSILLFPDQCNNDVTKIRELVVIAQSCRIVLSDATLSTPWIPEAWCFSAKKLVLNVGAEFLKLYEWFTDMLGPCSPSSGPAHMVDDPSPMQVFNVDMPCIELNINEYLRSSITFQSRFHKTWEGSARFNGTQGEHHFEADINFNKEENEGLVNVFIKDILASLDAKTISTLSDHGLDAHQEAASTNASQEPAGKSEGLSKTPLILTTQGKLYLNAELKYETEFSIESTFGDNVTFKSLDLLQLSVEDDILKSLIQVSGLSGMYDIHQGNIEVAVQEARGGFCADSLEHLCSTFSKLTPAKIPETFKTSINGLDLDVFDGIDEPMQQLDSLIQASKSRKSTNNISIDEFAEYCRGRTLEHEEASSPESLPFMPILDYFKSSRSQEEKLQPKGLTSGEMSLRVGKFSLSLYDGYDLTDTQKKLMETVDKMVKDRILGTEQLFESVFIGSSEADQTRDQLLQKINGDLGNTVGFIRSRKPKVVLSAGGLSLQATNFLDTASSSGGYSEFKLDLLKFSVRDKHPKSIYSHMITTLPRQAGTKTSVLSASLTNLRSPNSESRVMIDLCPLRISIFGGTLDFLTRFFQFKASSHQPPTSSAPQMRPSDDNLNETFFQRLEIQRLPLVLDYMPSPVKRTGLGSQSMQEVLNLFSLEQATVVLNHAVLRGLSGVEAVGKALAAIWTPDILSRQLLGLLSGFGPWKHLQGVGERVRHKSSHQRRTGQEISPLDDAQDMTASVLYINNSRGTKYPARPSREL